MKKSDLFLALTLALVISFSFLSIKTSTNKAFGQTSSSSGQTSSSSSSSGSTSSSSSGEVSSSSSSSGSTSSSSSGEASSSSSSSSGSSSSNISCIPQFTNCSCMTVCASEGIVIGACLNPGCTAMLDPTSVNCAVVDGMCIDTLNPPTGPITPPNASACMAQFSTCSCTPICVMQGDIGGECFNPNCNDDVDVSSIKCNLVNGECVVSATSSSSSGQVVCQPKFANCSCMTICSKSNETVGVCFNPDCTGMLDPTSVLCELDPITDSCIDVITSSNISLSTNFNGIWKIKPPASSTSSGSTSSSGECVVCTQVVPQCAPGEVLLPQNCESCAHCEGLGLLPIDPETGNMCVICGEVVIDCAATGLTNVPQSCTECQHCTSSGGSFPLRGSEPKEPKSPKPPRPTLLKLCVSNGMIAGTIDLSGLIRKGTITSQTVVSDTEVRVTVEGKKGGSEAITLKLNGDELVVSFVDGRSFTAKKLNSGICNGPSVTGMSDSPNNSMSGMSAPEDNGMSSMSDSSEGDDLNGMSGMSGMSDRPEDDDNP